MFKTAAVVIVAVAALAGGDIYIFLEDILKEVLQEVLQKEAVGEEDPAAERKAMEPALDRLLQFLVYKGQTVT